MSRKVDLFDSTYGNFETEVLARVRRKTFGEDFGQNSWTTAEEFRGWVARLGLGGRSRVLEVASGSGGPAVFLAELCGARVTGIELNALGVATARKRAAAHGVDERVTFVEADACAKLEFPDRAFDAIVCIDSACHFADRPAVLKEWQRVLAPGGSVLFTDPVVVTGPVSSEELAIRSSIGSFLFVPPMLNERWIAEAGFEAIASEDVSANAALVSSRWRDARAADREALVRIEGETRFADLQRFFDVVHRLTSERRVSRFVYFAKRRAID
ncbi:MAG: methyltransferase domain-containing protein [Planctomycetes bacterium]|nr:methyltransferase domain-containing protein [Planctomycetota bacterium]